VYDGVSGSGATGVVGAGVTTCIENGVDALTNG
jgi:hypothetical protein